MDVHVWTNNKKMNSHLNTRVIHIDRMTDAKSVAKIIVFIVGTCRIYERSQLRQMTQIHSHLHRSQRSTFDAIGRYANY